MQFCALVGNLPLCVLVLGLLTVIMVQPSPSLSHDLMGLIVEKARLDDASRDRIQEAEQRRQTLKQWLTKHPSFQPLESVLRMSAAWPTDSKVTVCFFDGSMDARSQVAAIAQQWTAYGNVKLDFGELGAPRTCNCNIRSQIRVSFQKEGFWSYIGTDSEFIGAHEPTLNLSGFDQLNVDQTEFRRVVLHEFGHALGFEHEHQSPNARCEEEFDWAYLYMHLPWSREQIAHNMKRLTASPDYAVSAYDPRSIMHYDLSEQYFLRRRNSPCFISPNSDLSEGDQRGMSRAYPTRLLVLSEERDELLKQLQSADIPDTTRQSVIRALERAEPRKAGKRLSEE